MSIEGRYRRITPKEFARLKRSSKAAESYFGLSPDDLEVGDKLLAKLEEEEANGRYFSIGTDWHALHFLLTGDGELLPHALPPPPLGNVVQGGTETEWPCTYGQIRFLTTEEVREVAKALKKILVGELKTRFSVKSFNAAGIYPHGRQGAWTDDDVTSLFKIYPRLVKFFQAAARDGDMILLSSD